MMCFHVRVWTGSQEETGAQKAQAAASATEIHSDVSLCGGEVLIARWKRRGEEEEAAGVGVFRVNVNKTSRALQR